MSIEITTSIPCLMNCCLCPQEVLRKQYVGPQFLPFEDFQRIILKIPQNIDITFSGFSEPFLNPQAIDMMEQANREGHDINLYSTLVGLKLEDVQRLKKIKLKKVYLHLPDNLGNAHIPITDEYKTVFFSILRTVDVTGFSIMNRHFPNNGRAGNLGLQTHRRGFFNCTYLDNNIFVTLPNGDVVLCCMDYGLQHVIGNLLQETYEDLLTSSAYRNIKKNRFALDGTILCRTCKCAYNPIFYYAMKTDRAIKRLALRFFSKDAQAREKLIEEYDETIHRL